MAGSWQDKSRGESNYRFGSLTATEFKGVRWLRRLRFQVGGVLNFRSKNRVIMTDEVLLDLSALLHQAADCHRRGDQATLALITAEILKRFRAPLRLWIRQAVLQSTRQTLAHNEIADRICLSIIGRLVASLPGSVSPVDLGTHLRQSLWRAIVDGTDISHASAIASSLSNSREASPDGCQNHKQ